MEVREKFETFYQQTAFCIENRSFDFSDKVDNNFIDNILTPSQFFELITLQKDWYYS